MVAAPPGGIGAERAAAAGGTTALAGATWGGTTVRWRPVIPIHLRRCTSAWSRSPRARSRQDSRLLRRQRRAFQLLRAQFERSYFPARLWIRPNTEGLMFTEMRRCGHSWSWQPAGHKVASGAGRHWRCHDRPAAREPQAWGYRSATTPPSSSWSRPAIVMWKRFSETGVIKAKSVIIAAGVIRDELR